MSSDNLELIEAARSIVGEFNLHLDFTAGSVAAALRTVDGNIYTGICIDITCGLGFCAEVAAIAQMLAKRETQIIQIVAVGKKTILPPCGRCRETIAQVDGRNLDRICPSVRGAARRTARQIVRADFDTARSFVDLQSDAGRPIRFRHHPIDRGVCATQSTASQPTEVKPCL